MPKREVEFFIVDMLIAIEVIKRKVRLISTADDLLCDEDVWFSVLRQCEIIGEAMKHVLRDKRIKDLTKRDWQDIVDFRNIVAHEYFGINHEQIFDIVKNEVTKLEEEIKEFLIEYPDGKKIKWAINQAIVDLEKARRLDTIKYLEEIQKSLV